ncbi:hypothetical protein GW764_01255 [Candidatus Parcubacteria bacterium]|nr:hypothetical protein [Candidatus Parcubacteria bacterium]
MEKTPQENFEYNNQNSEKQDEENFVRVTPENSDIPIDKEGLSQKVSEEEIDVSPEALYKLKIEFIKQTLSEKIVSVNVVREIQNFAIGLKEKYGPSVYDKGLYHVLIGGSLEGDEDFEDFEGGDSIVKFVKEL